MRAPAPSLASAHPRHSTAAQGLRGGDIRPYRRSPPAPRSPVASRPGVSAFRACAPRPAYASTLRPRREAPSVRVPGGIRPVRPPGVSPPSFSRIGADEGSIFALECQPPSRSVRSSSTAPIRGCLHSSLRQFDGCASAYEHTRALPSRPSSRVYRPERLPRRPDPHERRTRHQLLAEHPHISPPLQRSATPQQRQAAIAGARSSSLWSYACGC